MSQNQPDKDPGPSGGGEQEREYPPAELSLQAARRLMGGSRGNVKVVRRYASVGIATWRVEAALQPSDGPNFELEVEGASLPETAFALVDALETCGFRVE